MLLATFKRSIKEVFETQAVNETFIFYTAGRSCNGSILDDKNHGYRVEV